jgi:hypothetical protein
MKTFFYFLLFMLIAVVAIVIGVIIGDYGSWYFAWLIGTVMIILAAAGAGALFDTKEDEQMRRGSDRL